MKDNILNQQLNNYSNARVWVSHNEIDSGGFFIKDYYIITTCTDPGFSKDFTVIVNNVSGCGHSYSYFTDIVGIYNTHNIRVGEEYLVILKISKEGNEGKPQINSYHPYFKLSKSEKCGVGSKISMLVNSRTIVRGHIISSFYDILLHDISIPHDNGNPLINKKGKVIGISVSRSNIAYMAHSLYSLGNIIKTIIKCYENIPDRRLIGEFDHHLTYKENYIEYLGGNIEIDWRWNEFCSLPNGEAIGLIVTTSKYEGIIKGDIVTHIDGIPVGFFDHQLSPKMIVARKIPGDKIIVTSYSRLDEYKIMHENIILVE